MPKAHELERSQWGGFIHHLGGLKHKLLFGGVKNRPPRATFFLGTGGVGMENWGGSTPQPPGNASSGLTNVHYPATRSDAKIIRQ